LRCSLEGEFRQMADEHFRLAGDTLRHNLCYASLR
jgi:hypothetical protein